MKTILAPVDFSGATASVVREARTLALGANARVTLLTVVTAPSVSVDYTGLSPSMIEVNAVGERAAAEGLEKLRRELQNTFLVVDTVQVTGVPAVCIVEQAHALNADYIVIGSHGHTALYDLLVGSTTHAVLKHAPCPVVIVPREAAK